MLDDNPETAEMLAKNNIRVLLYDAPYNKNIAHERITRVGNWKDIEKQLKIIEKTL
jgi:5'(3')-deoxyribonucleotidase